MTQDAIISLLTKLAITAFSSYLGAHTGLDPSTASADIGTVIGTLGTLGSIGFGVYQHWNMIKVPAPNAH